MFYKPFISTYLCVYNREYDYCNSHDDHYADSQHCNDDGYDRNYRYFRDRCLAVTRWY